MTQIVPSVTVPVTIPEPEATLTPALVAGLAREIAIGLRDMGDILASFKITPATYEKLKTNEFFTKAVDTYRIEWHSAPNTANRMQLECAATAEQGLPHAYARAISGNEPFNHVVDFFKWCSDVGGLKKDPSRGQPGERFQITINLGTDTKIEYDGSRAPITGDPVLEALPMPTFDEREDRT